MTITLDTIARIYCLEVEEILSFIDEEFESYGIVKQEPIQIQTADANRLVENFRNSKTKPCDVCKKPTALSPRNLNLFDGFRDAALGMFICNSCRNNPEYLAMKTVSTLSDQVELQHQDPEKKVSANTQYELNLKTK